MTEVQEKVSGWGERWPAPAKLNLMLRITGRRSDGYHLLQTVFQIIDLCDWISFYPAEDGRVFLRDPIPGVPEQEDLTVRAANLLKQYTGCRLGVCIDVEKNLPMGGGLGGGSSDAATTLLVLNKLWNLKLPLDKLMELGLRLGADVPVFVYGYTAWGEGVGEELQSITLAEQWVVVIKPDCHVNTRQIFLAEELTRDSKPITMRDFIAGDWKNDCLPVVSNLYKSVGEAVDALSQYAEARLTGTGACVFAQFDSEESAREAFSALSPNWSVYLAQGLNRSPLYEKLEQGSV
ncbi:4-(cytidine 5'-diphospho)-2-C-methyl-D-erythritol kinase [Methylomonas albis]|uniref:4-diphosphocytidyl-2-C-methyl-D-erythritol kinase n=1 Tax=Methylomonas albis TaxID=1854563 RepID=A0ABR9CYC7_9GAMM|nr:4-(cytidine 5'-diphospho)-2-C-methyl-D-erythritol kinase [Methylomonas albis]MBD9354998.1 4-(cytidine 5'-diphospho)-2-C-methyl-D-erythritol kinase [Methylomonas albis]